MDCARWVRLEWTIKYQRWVILVLMAWDLNQSVDMSSP